MIKISDFSYQTVSVGLSVLATSARLHVVTLSHRQEQPITVRAVLPWQARPRGTHCHASLHDKQLSVTSFRRLLKTHLFRRAYVGTPWAQSWLFPVRAGEHKLLDLDLDLKPTLNACPIYWPWHSRDYALFMPRRRRRFWQASQLPPSISPRGSPWPLIQ